MKPVIRSTVLILVIAAIALAVVSTFSVRYEGSTRAEDALVRAQTIAIQMQAYHIRTEEWPESLDDLVRPPDGGRPFLEDGEYAILDPWGKYYQFEIVTDDNGKERVRVWTTSPDGKMIQFTR